ncbi:MAG: hypothetical protein JXQ72_01510 [Anaerolineae bacterium]|nr:hypothetical protein [Anaerolineae bacterium]
MSRHDPPRSHAISLLWPSGYDRRRIERMPRLSQCAADDLDLDRTVEALSGPHGHAKEIRAILLTLCDDPAVIRFRQDVLQNLLDVPELADRLRDTLPDITTLLRFQYTAWPQHTPLHEVAWRVGQLESYVACVQRLGAVFEGLDHRVTAAGWRHLRDLIDTIRQDGTFQRLVDELPDLITRVRSVASVTIGVNLDDQLRPFQATLLAINADKFKGVSPSLLNTLFGKQASNTWEGIAPLRTTVQNPPPGLLGPVSRIDVENPMLYPLFRDLADILKRVSRPVASALQHYARLNVAFLGDLRVELAYYLGAVRLIDQFTAGGLPVCWPELAPVDDRVCTLVNAYNLNLALRLIHSDGERGLSGKIVTNAITFGPEGRIAILTGPNQGGKTTYTQAAGLAHVLAQAGLFVPGASAVLSPVDGIYTHFPVEEQPDAESGRLGEEAGRLSELFEHATRHSLVLLNETLSSTSPGEGIYLARDVVRTLRRLGARVIYATHYHDLAAGIDDLNASTPGDSRVFSLVSHVDRDGAGHDVPNNGFKQTFRIVSGPPVGRSYAREIAARYGISYEQLVEQLRQRGVMDGH